jgi:hypothetical protein
LDYAEGVSLISAELVKQLTQTQTTPTPMATPAPEDDQTEAMIEEFKRRRKQVQEDREVGIYSQVEALEKIAALDDQIARQEQKRQTAKESSYVREEFKDLLGGEKLEHFTEWVLDDDPQVVHRLLHALCEKITIHPDHHIDIAWRSGVHS